MKYRSLTPAAVLATLALTVTPAFAQHSSGGHSRSSGSSGSSRGSSGGSSGGARSSGPSRTYSAPSSRTYSTAPRTYGAQSRGVYAQSRGSAVARGPVSRGFVSRGYGSRGYGSRGVFVAPFRFYRPFYSFRPRISLGFGLWVGYPISYPYSFYYGYPYAYPYDPYYYDPYYEPAYPPPSYSYPIPNSSSAYPPANYPQANYPPANYPQSNGSGQNGYYESDRDDSPQPGTSLTAEPGAPSGGVSFEITPSTAEVLIDGKFAGHVSDLGPTRQPLGLTPGRHHIEIRAAGYQTMVVDADVVAGQVIPYQGQMQPGR
jgi:hypothetical protein